MKRLRLFPKTFVYTLGLFLFIIVIAHILLYFLMSKMQIEFSSKESIADKITIEIREEKIVMEAAKSIAIFFYLLLCSECGLFLFLCEGDCEACGADFCRNATNDGVR